MNTGIVARYAETLLSTRRMSQAGSLYVAVLSTVAVGFVTSVITTRILGPEDYGNMKFIGNAFQMVAIVSTIGIFTTGSQLLARFGGDEQSRKSLLGSLFFFGLMLSAGGMAVSVMFSFVEDSVFGHDLGVYFLIFSPLVAVLILQPCIENILQGENKIHELSLFRFMPGGVYMVCILAGSFLLHLTLPTVLLLQLISGLIVVLAYYRHLRPTMTGPRTYMGLIWRANRQYGWQVYLGVLAGVATTYMSTFMISYFLDNTQVGFFSLAMTLTLPLMQIASVVGTTYFKEFANTDTLPLRVTVATIAIAFFAYAGFLLLVKPLVLLAYTDRFERVASLASIVGLGAVFHGLGDYFNRFLGAHRRGRDLRNGAIAVGAMNVAGYSILVKLFGLDGAAVTRVLGSGIYCGMMFRYYRLYRREHPVTAEEQRDRGNGPFNHDAPEKHRGRGTTRGII